VEHDDAPAPLVEPAAHTVHALAAEAPVPELNVPAAHAVRSALPGQ